MLPLAEPVLLPSTLDPVVGSSRVGLVGTASTTGSADVTAHAEAAFLARIAVSAEAGLASDRDDPLLGAQVRADLLHSDAFDAGAALRYDRVGFDGADASLEARLAGAWTRDETRLVANLALSRDVDEDEGDAEASVSALRTLGRASVGLDTRVRLAIGDADGDDDPLDTERRGWDARAGAVVTLAHENVAGYAMIGAELVRDRDVAAVASAGIQVGF
jgi:hypothetical protein